ncbi:3-hydroxyacyl-ACP dehydratase FabZ family protein [Planctomycetota bacterium]
MPDQTILELLPHREPFLFLDTVEELTKDRIRALRLLKADEFYFQGHYPGYPLMPGVLLCEAVLQAGAALISFRNQGYEKDMSASLPVVTRLKDVKFKRQVRPGDTLEIESELTEQLANAYYLKGTVKVAGKTALYLEFSVASVKPREETA